MVLKSVLSTYSIYMVTMFSLHLMYLLHRWQAGASALAVVVGRQTDRWTTELCWGLLLLYNVHVSSITLGHFFSSLLDSKEKYKWFAGKVRIAANYFSPSFCLNIIFAIQSHSVECCSLSLFIFTEKRAMLLCCQAWMLVEQGQVHLGQKKRPGFLHHQMGQWKHDFKLTPCQKKPLTNQYSNLHNNSTFSHPFSMISSHFFFLVLASGSRLHEVFFFLLFLWQCGHKLHNKISTLGFMESTGIGHCEDFWETFQSFFFRLSMTTLTRSKNTKIGSAFMPAIM